MAETITDGFPHDIEHMKTLLSSDIARSLFIDRDPERQSPGTVEGFYHRPKRPGQIAPLNQF